MVEAAAQQLTEYVYNEAGDELRTVVIVREDGFDIQYLRDDLKETYDPAEYESVVDSFRLDEPYLSPETAEKPVGERNAILHYHENACVIQIPFSTSETILVSVSRQAGQQLVSFLERCRQIAAEGDNR